MSRQEGDGGKVIDARGRFRLLEEDHNGFTGYRKRIVTLMRELQKERDTIERNCNDARLRLIKQQHKIHQLEVERDGPTPRIDIKKKIEKAVDALVHCDTERKNLERDLQEAEKKILPTVSNYEEIRRDMARERRAGNFVIPSPSEIVDDWRDGKNPERHTIEHLQDVAYQLADWKVFDALEDALPNAIEDASKLRQYRAGTEPKETGAKTHSARKAYAKKNKLLNEIANMVQIRKTDYEKFWINK